MMFEKQIPHGKTPFIVHFFGLALALQLCAAPMLTIMRSSG